MTLLLVLCVLTSAAMTYAIIKEAVRQLAKLTKPRHVALELLAATFVLAFFVSPAVVAAILVL